MTDLDQAFSQPSRQSPLAVFFLAWRLLRQISIVNIIFIGVAVSSGRLPISGIGLLAAGAVILGGIGLLSWWRFVFVVQAGELRVDKGILAHEHLAIPLGRVQTVRLEQGLLHQVLGLTRVSIDTAGSSEVEFKFDALDRRSAEQLQQIVARYRAEQEPSHPNQIQVGPVVPWLVDAPPPVGPPNTSGVQPAAPIGGPSLTTAPPDPPAQTLAIRSFVDLVKIGIGSWPWAGLVFVFPLLAFTDDLQELVGLDVLGNLSDWFEQVDSGEVGESVPLSLLISGVVGFLVLATLAGWMFQITRAVLTHWEMTLSLTKATSGETLKRDAGLLNRTTVSAHLARLQNVRVSQNMLQRILGIHMVALHVTGETNIDIPGSSADEVDHILDIVVPGVPPDLDREVAGSYVLRETRTGALIAAPIVVLVAVTLGWVALLGLLIPVQAFVSGLMYWKSMRWGFSDNRIGYRHGLLSRQWHHLELVKTQSVTVRQSWFERRRGLATFRIRSAEANLAIPFIPKAEAETLRDLVLANVESSNRSWM